MGKLERMDLVFDRSCLSWTCGIAEVTDEYMRAGAAAVRTQRLVARLPKHNSLSIIEGSQVKCELNASGK